ncbi:MAG: acetate--CoA ligase family protein, partial [Rhodobacteraceae bacterium]|nr:acetate--CoA ligase family protein [Paracoccaceae bacterium]
STALAKHGDRRRTLMDIEARDEFAGTELKFPQVLFARDCRELEEAAEQLAFPVVLKRPGIQHKTEEGAVVLDIRDAGQLLASAVKMGGDRGYLVEQQVAGAVAEILIGVTRELESALLLTIGSGGIHTELFKDVRHLLLPTKADSVLRELKRLRAWKLLEGFRGRSGGDVGSLVQAALAVGNYAVRNAETLVDIEVNPFLVLPNSGYAVDLVINTNMKRTSAK